MTTAPSAPTPEERAAVLTLRDNVVALRARFHRGEVPLEQLYAAVDDYIAAAEKLARRRWPHVKFRRPSRAYIARAL
jgi:hypothetical protein